MKSSWEQRIRRAEELFERYPFAQEILRFYREVLLFQQGLYRRFASAEGGGIKMSSSPRRGLVVEHLLPQFPSFLSLVAEVGPPVLASQAEELASRPKEGWEVLFCSYWEKGTLPDGQEAASPLLFFPKAFLQPYGEFLAEGWQEPEIQSPRSSCPFCGSRPQVGRLKGVGEGAQLFLVCSLCSTEWPFKRIACPSCGEEDPRRLSYYQADEFPHIRVGACESCQRYLKGVDLTRDGKAVPVVDELASIPLDIWAREQGYRKFEPNLAGF